MWLQGVEPASTRVQRALDAGAVMSWLNVGEVFYWTARAESEERARRVVDEVRGRAVLDLPTPARVLEAASLKARRRMAYADAFAVATAIAHDAVVLTGDPEILATDGSWRVEDLRG